MSGRPFAVTLVGVWSLLSAVGGGYHAWLLLDSPDQTRITLAVAALGALIGVLLIAAGIGVLRTQQWARAGGLLALALATLVVLVGAADSRQYVLASGLAAGNVLAIIELVRHKKPFSDADGRVEDVSAHVGR